LAGRATAPASGSTTPARAHQQAIEGSLKRLRLERIDVYQLHVPDPAVSFDASMEALARLKEQGKIRHVGLSNVTLEHIQSAQKSSPS
jgi:pyridoxine 4-dehydrogenase